MKVYEFKCADCSVAIEESAPLTNRTHCGKPMKRVYGLTAISFKGPGFYTNDKKR